MKKLLIAITILIAMPFWMKAQTYSALWKQVKDAEQKDLPQTAQQVLGQIVTKAGQEANYGQLLKAELQRARSQCDVAPDSLRPVVEQLTARAVQADGNIPLQAIYHCVLGYIYRHNRWLDEDHHQEIAHDYFEKALAHPAELAQVKATGYEPFVIKGQDSRYFGDDLLSLIGYEAERYDLLRDYYMKAGDRIAALLATDMLLSLEAPDEMEPLNKSHHIQRIDSLIEEYQDLVECGEAAITRYDYMDEYTDATAEQKWQYINMALERWGDWQGMNYLRNKQRELTCPLFHAAAKSITIPLKEQKLRLYELRNVSDVTLRIYKVRADGNTDLNPSSQEGYKKLKPLLTALPQLTQTRKFMGKRPYEVFEDSMMLPALPVGVYMLEMESLPATQVVRQLYFVSDVRVLTQSQPASSGEKGNELRIVVVNATTGQPIKGATVRVTQNRNRSNAKTTTLTSSEGGECSFPGQRGMECELWAYTADDKACPPCSQWGMFLFDNGERHDRKTSIFTDRAIYRPGQTVHVAVVRYRQKDISLEACAGEQLNLTLKDANWKDVSEQQVTTDQFGTAKASFVLPTSGLTGSFSIVVNNEQSQNIRVEEYKRPAFEVDIPRVAQNYEDGDTVVARGTARSYAGVPVQGATVKYKVVRRRAFWWMSYSRYWDMGYIGTGTDDEVVAEGETTTDERGQFTADMPMVLPKTRHTMFYNFVLTADVTDQAGETHQGTMSLPLGNRKTAFTASLPEKVLNEGNTKMTFHLQNAAGIDLEGQVRYRFDNQRWQEAATNALIAIPQLKSGKHTLFATCQQDTLEQDFVVFSLDDHRPATDTRSWFYTSHEGRFPMDGGPVTVQAGSSDKNVHMVYSVISGNKLLESGAVDLSNELLNRKFLYREEYGNGLLLTFAWMKDGETYEYSTHIQRPMPDMHLDMKWQTFRNRLTPGQQEEWTLSITKPDGSPADAQLVATLYDKSLDQLMPHEWGFGPSVWLPLPQTNWNKGIWYRNSAVEFSAEKQQQWLSWQQLQYSHFDHDVYPQYNFYARRRVLTRGLNAALSDNMVMAQAADEEGANLEIAFGTQKASMTSGAVMKADDALQGRIAGLDIQSADSGEGEQAAPMQMRENLQETAFFMPQLVCDSTGRVSMKFTLPESLTTWRFLGVAHTRDMMYGSMSDEAVARKDVMIQPNMPRFLRQGDQGTISARVMNMSDQPLSGTTMLQLLDPETEKVIMEQKQQVTVKDSSTVSVTFPVDATRLSSLVSTLCIARVSISTPKQSDGEQHYLPILPNAERVTVTVPFTQNGPGTKAIDLEQLIPKTALKSPTTNLQPQITIEYTNNPAWLLIQALPTVGHPHDDCAVCQAASLYANSIGRHILGQNPTAKHVFELWKQEEKTAIANSSLTTLHSSLQKNQSLKDLVLSETPWVMDADNEQEQRQRLADFFDQNLMAQRISQALDKLGKLQRTDGSWSWWPDMPGSVYMTTSVCEMLVRLNQMAGQQSATAKMLSSAFTFLGKDIVELVDEMKKEEKKGHKQVFPSHRALQWLYICALDGRELPAKVSEANSYLKNLLKKETQSQSIYEKALSAIVLQNKTYIRSLKEWTVYKEDMGRYYDTQRAGYSWRDYKIPTQVAAIEALKRLTPQDTVTISEMQRWLLQQRRTQAWDTPLNSADAIYAFLDGNSQTLAPQPKTTLSINGKPLPTSDATAGIGYVKTSVDAQGAKTFKAEKTSTGTSWGAVYAQFMQPASDIADQQSGISVKRELLNAQHSALDAQHSTLQVGDRIIVRITIEADRDYDFVQLQDKRAACLEPVKQLSGYNWREGYYCAPKDYTTNFFFDMLSKGRHVIETEYYVDREGTYETGTCSVQCTYSPEFRGSTKSMKIEVKSHQ